MRIKTIVCMLLLSLCSIAATAQENFSDGDFRFAVNENAATLTGYTGSGGAVTIPGEVTINGTKYPVTAIRNYVFLNCTTLTSITFPSSITRIGEDTFGRCTALTSVTFLPNSLTIIEGHAFGGCSNLTSVTLPNNSVKVIGYGAFSGCRSLTSITLPNSLTAIEEGAFYDCSGLTSVEIPNSVTAIGASAFSDCYALTSVVIPNSITNIGEGAFSYCYALTSVHIPNSVTAIGASAFSDCTGLTDVYVSWQTPLEITADAFTVLTLGKITLHVLSPGKEADYRTAAVWKNFRAENAQTFEADGFTFTVTGDATVEVSGHTAGADPEITLPARATDGNGKTYDVTAIGSAAFTDRNELTSVTLGNSVTSIGYAAFAGCRGLTSVTIPNSVTTIEEYAFAACSGLTSVEIPHSVTSIEGSTFLNCSGLTSVTIPNSVTNIGARAFESCEGLTSVTIPHSVTSIGEDAFYDCGSLTSVTIPTSVTTIGGWAFAECIALTSVEIPHSVTAIGERAFDYCLALTDVYVSWQTPLEITADVFNYLTPGEITLHVPEGTEAVYRAADTWKEFRIAGDLPNAVASLEAQKVWAHGGALHVHTPQAERIEVYALSGQLLYVARKDAGPTVFSRPSLPRGVLIVRGSTGWTEKTVNN